MLSWRLKGTNLRGLQEAALALTTCAAGSNEAENKVAVITGATCEIGAGIARALAASRYSSNGLSLRFPRWPIDAVPPCRYERT